MLIIAAVVGLVIVMSGIGTALAVMASRNGSNTGGITGDLPTPSPAGSPPPVASPTAGPTGNQASTTTLTVPIPAGWSVAATDSESITLADPNGNAFVTVASGRSSPVQTAQQNKDQVDQGLKTKYPDTKPCPNTSTTSGSLNGAKGLFWTLCFTLTSGSRSAPAAAALFVGANGDGSVYYAVMELATQDNLQHLIAEAKPILQGVQWKLT